MSHGKRYAELHEKVDREREYEPAEAVGLVRGLASTKFDESVEVHVRTGLNVRHADEQLRGTIALPNGLGKDVKVVSGPLSDFSGEISEINEDAARLKVLVSIFGRETPVEVGFDQVKKL